MREIDNEEYQAYIDYLEKKHNRKVKELRVDVISNEEVGLHYTFEHVPFERIRRITGYLTGDVNTWNDAKVAELEDRVAHGLSDKMERI